ERLPGAGGRRQAHAAGDDVDAELLRDIARAHRVPIQELVDEQKQGANTGDPLPQPEPVDIEGHQPSRTWLRAQPAWRTGRCATKLSARAAELANTSPNRRYSVGRSMSDIDDTN